MESTAFTLLGLDLDCLSRGSVHIPLQGSFLLQGFFISPKRLALRPVEIGLARLDLPQTFLGP